MDRSGVLFPDNILASSCVDRFSLHGHSEVFLGIRIVLRICHGDFPIVALRLHLAVTNESLLFDRPGGAPLHRSKFQWRRQ
jgi:hypothetical protein